MKKLNKCQHGTQQESVLPYLPTDSQARWATNLNNNMLNYSQNHKRMYAHKHIDPDIPVNPVKLTIWFWAQNWAPCWATKTNAGIFGQDDWMTQLWRGFVLSKLVYAWHVNHWTQLKLDIIYPGKCSSYTVHKVAKTTDKNQNKNLHFDKIHWFIKK